MANPNPAVLPYIDPHAGQAIPNIRFSTYHEMTLEDPTFMVRMIDEVERFQVTHETGRGEFIPQDLRLSEVSKLINEISKDPRAMQFILNCVIPVGHGHQPLIVQDKLRELLQDPSMWDELEQHTGHQTADSPAIDFLHTDSAKPLGHLRIGFSPQKSTRFRTGWHKLEREGIEVVPMVDAQGTPTTSVEQPEPGTVALWEISSGVHDVPMLGEQDWQEFSKRDFVSLTFSFDRVVERARELAFAELESGSFSGQDQEPPELVDDDLGQDHIGLTRSDIATPANGTTSLDNGVSLVEPGDIGPIIDR